MRTFQKNCNYLVIMGYIAVYGGYSYKKNTMVHFLWAETMFSPMENVNKMRLFLLGKYV